MIRLLLPVLLGCLFVLSCEVKALESNVNYAKLLDSYYSQDEESIIYQDVLDVAKIIVNSRKNYSSDVIAKAFSLLSDIAFNRGDLVTALQFAEYGIDVEKRDILVKLDLWLKLARGYYSQGKYTQLKEISKKSADLAEQLGNVNYYLMAKTYSVIAYALSADYNLAVSELSKVEYQLSQNQHLIDQIGLLEIIAQAHFYLAEYDYAIGLLNRVLTLRVEMSKKKGLARTYHLIATAYYQLHQYDNAYNAYWESRTFALTYDLNIRASYAELGLGEVLLQQQNFTQAKVYLVNAQATFGQHNLLQAKLSTLIALVKVYEVLNEPKKAVHSLLKAEYLADKITLMPQQIELYLLLAKYYRATNKFQQAFEAQRSYINFYQGVSFDFKVRNAMATIAMNASNRRKNIALNLTQESELSAEFSDKYKRQKLLIIFLAIAVSCFGFSYIVKNFRRYRNKLQRSYDEIELPKNQLAPPVRTKLWYQQQYKIARKYQYEISIGYLIVENWQELNFHFRAKILTDVYQSIALIVNENLEKEDYAGEISAGEYLFLCPHQNTEQMLIKMVRIKEAIKAIFFANLGEHSVKISFLVDSPNIQDIDPYVFLSRLSDRTNAEFSE